MEEHQPYLPYRRVFTYQQFHEAPAQKIFPLLCPEREKEWLDGWDYEMVYSQSGLIEQDCIFQTSHNGHTPTTWMVTKYDLPGQSIEFFRLRPSECVVKINIDLDDMGNGTSCSNIAYQYTAITPQQAEFIHHHMEEFFNQSMQWWEKAINHFLATGEMLKKNQAS
jgi:hypothetical protein